MGEASPQIIVLPVDDAKLVERYQSQFGVVFPNVPAPKKRTPSGAQVVTPDIIRRIQEGALDPRRAKTNGWAAKGST